MGGIIYLTNELVQECLGNFIPPPVPVRRPQLAESRECLDIFCLDRS